MIPVLAQTTADHMVWGFIAGAIVGALVALFGGAKGRLDLGIGGFFACAISGAILGLILAVPVGAFFAWKIGKSDNKSSAQDLRTKCPHCAEIILLEAKLCKHCGKELSNSSI